MSSYLQMGNDSKNLVGEKDLERFLGVILSPVNEEPGKMPGVIRNIRNAGQRDVLLDPQLYCPRSKRGSLPAYDYFPKDIETADLSSTDWWLERARNLATYIKENNLDIDAVASPLFRPAAWPDDFYLRCAETSAELYKALKDQAARVLTTVIVDYGHLQSNDAPLRIASILSEPETDGYYIVLCSDTDPRRELSSSAALTAMMQLIQALEGTGKPVIVSNTGAEMLLYKLAGASHCAAGKYFNLRRFSPARYEEKDEDAGGGQAAYWFEHSLLAFLRLADVLRLQNNDKFSSLLNTGFSNNYWSAKLLENFETLPQGKGLKEGWRQFLAWFAKTEDFLDAHADPASQVKLWLKEAEENWLALEDVVLFDEPRNNGSWLRPWRQAAASFLAE